MIRPDASVPPPGAEPMIMVTAWPLKEGPSAASAAAGQPRASGRRLARIKSSGRVRRRIGLSPLQARRTASIRMGCRSLGADNMVELGRDVGHIAHDLLDIGLGLLAGPRQEVELGAAHAGAEIRVLQRIVEA